MTDATNRHRAKHRDFKWSVPELFNFGAIVDHFAGDPTRVFWRCGERR